MFNRIFISFIFLFALQPDLVVAQTKQVQVEVIIFQTLATRGWTEERWADAVTLSENMTQHQKAISPHSSQNFARLVKPNQLLMQKEVAKMTPDKGYQVLSHFGWVQDTLPETQSVPVLIDSSLQQARLDSSSIYGSLKFYQERFAHIDLELELDRVIPASVRARFAENQQLDPEFLDRSWRFQIKESRRIRPNEIHYLDHPLFGVLVKFVRLN